MSLFNSEKKTNPEHPNWFLQENVQRKNLWMGLRFLLTTDRQKLARPLPCVAAGRRCKGANISQAAVLARNSSRRLLLEVQELQLPPFSKCMVPKPEAEPGEQSPTTAGRAWCQLCAQNTVTVFSVCALPFRESALCLNNSFLLCFSF